MAAEPRATVPACCGSGAAYIEWHPKLECWALRYGHAIYLKVRFCPWCGRALQLPPEKTP